MASKKVDPHALGYRFYRGYIYRQPHAPSDRVSLWDPWGLFICSTWLEDVRPYVDRSIKLRLDTPQLKLF